MAIAEHDIKLDTFESLNPATGEVLGSFPVHDEAAVREAVERAQDAARWWADLGFDERKRRLLAFNGVIARRIDELADLISAENGKPRGDAELEIIFTIEHLGWAARKAKRVLGRHLVPPTALTSNHLSYIDHQPMGVVGIIGPWNFPVHTPMGSIAYALAAGNAVVYKPSEYTPAVGRWLADAFSAVVAEQPVFQVVTGFGETGAALCRAGVDRLAFTGSEGTGRKVMAACAETLTPVTLELGGNDAFIVDDDADLDFAARTAALGGFFNTGQACVGTERLYVVDSVYDAFVERLVQHTREVGCTPEDSCLGPITMPGQIDVIRRHLEDALDRGAKAIVGGLESVRPPYVDPVVLVDVPRGALVLTEETFGPVLPVTRVDNAETAIAHANATAYGLASIYFGKARAKLAAAALRAGVTAVNSNPMMAHLNPALPFGGVGSSGFGRIHGADGLREFTHVKSVTRELFPLPRMLQMNRIDRDPKGLDLIKRTVRFRHGRR